MPSDYEDYIDMVDAMTIRELKAEKERLNRQWSSHTTKQYKHIFGAIVTGPYGIYKSSKAAGSAMDAASKSAVVDARMKELECYTHSRPRDFGIGVASTMLTSRLGDVAGEAMQGVFSEIDHDRHYSCGEELACKGVEHGVEKGGEMIIDRALEYRNHSEIVMQRICDGCHEKIGAWWYQCSVCDNFDYCGSCWLKKWGVGHPQSHTFRVQVA